MSDELSPEMLEEATPDLLTLEDEDGKEVTFEVIDATEVNGTRYLAVIPYQEDPESLQEDAELILMRIGTDEEGEYMDIVDDDEELLGERHAIEEVFNNWEILQPTGGAIRMYNKIVAFSIGEMLNDDTAIIHFEKSDPNIRGLYQVINHEFVVHAWPHTTYINREEDMGIPGLRHSKESYNPHHYVEKFDVTLKK